jgi:hypothetical protein
MPNCSSLLIINESLLIEIIQTTFLDEKLHSLVGCWDLLSLFIYIAQKNDLGGRNQHNGWSCLII